MAYTLPFFEGLAMGASLIIAIGAQNAFVLKQGLKQQLLFLTALTCSICDSSLIILGTLGMGELISDFPLFEQIMRWGGAIFLTAYGLRSFWQAFHSHSLQVNPQQSSQKSTLATFMALVGFTFLNPHTYIDTFLILGTIGAEHSAHEKLPFVLGAICASFIWFFSLTYGASRCSPLFQNPRTWKILDTMIGVVMLSIAVSLVT